MSEQRWIVTWMSAKGATRFWEVDGDNAKKLADALHKGPADTRAPWWCFAFRTTTGHATVWLTPGQTLTVERANG